MAVNHFTQLSPTRRLLATMVAFSFAGIIAVGAMAPIAGGKQQNFPRTK